MHIIIIFIEIPKRIANQQVQILQGKRLTKFLRVEISDLRAELARDISVVLEQCILPACRESQSLIFSLS